MQKIKFMTAAACAILLTGGGANAQFGKLKIPGAGDILGQNSYDVAAGKANFFATFQSAQTEIIAAQLLLAEALDLDEQAQALKVTAASLSSGDLDSETANESIRVSNAANAAISEKLDAGAELTDEGREKYIQSIPHLLVGTAQATKLPEQGQDLVTNIQQVMKSGGPSQKIEAAKLVGPMGSIAQRLPGFTSSTLDCYRKVVTFGQANNLPMPEDATSLL
jgi:hypothetical protein